MKKAVVAFLLGLICLFIFSVTYGVRVFSAWERRIQAERRLAIESATDQYRQAARESRAKRIRLSMNSFDLANGLTFQDLENFRDNSSQRLVGFLYLMAALWLAWGLRWSRRRL